MADWHPTDEQRDMLARFLGEGKDISFDKHPSLLREYAMKYLTAAPPSDLIQEVERLCAWAAIGRSGKCAHSKTVDDCAGCLRRVLTAERDTALAEVERLKAELAAERVRSRVIATTGLPDVDHALSTEAERNAARQELHDCYLASGADSDGDGPEHLQPGDALKAVKRLRADQDDSIAADRASFSFDPQDEATHPEPSDPLLALLRECRDTMKGLPARVSPPAEVRLHLSNLARRIDALDPEAK